VAVVDTGLDIHHTDLANNVVSNTSWDFVGNDTDPTPASGTDSDHGTMVGGIIGMVGWNNVGGRGVAPNAKLAGFNFMSSQSGSNLIASIGGNKSSNFHVFNQSWGSADNTTSPVSSTYFDYYSDIAQYRSAASGKPIRNGKGAVFIKSSGNGFNYQGYSCGEAGAPVSCANASLDTYALLPEQIVVSAINADGIRSSYSTAGSSVWISALGGEFGLNNQYGSSSNTNAFKPALITTDVSGCSTGRVKSSTGSANYTPFETGNHPENPNCDYVSTMNGTSSAAPVASGIVALMLEANPNLTWRDVKHVLASTADQVDASITPVSFTLSDGSYIAEPAWTTNAAGYRFHNWYGFGRINAQNAVAMAKTYSSYLPATSQQTTGFVKSADFPNNGRIPDNAVMGASSSVSISTPITKIEAVQLQLNSVTHPRLGDLGFTLISPSGTRSVLLPAINQTLLGSATSLTFMLESNAFYQENPNGNWTISVVDALSDNIGTITSASLRIYGH
jgi:subtilisin-like proprotein convertase family protein